MCFLSPCHHQHKLTMGVLPSLEDHSNHCKHCQNWPEESYMRHKHLLTSVGNMCVNGFSWKSSSCYNIYSVKKVTILMPLPHFPLPSQHCCFRCCLHPSTSPRRPIYPILSLLRWPSIIVYFTLQTS